MFCGIIVNSDDNERNGLFDLNINVVDGRYDIITEEQGREILIIDTVEISGVITRRCRRITSQFDWVYYEQGKTWTNISNASAGSVIFS